MLPAILLGAASLASSIYGGIKSSQAANKQKRYLEDTMRQQERDYNRRKSELQNWYDRRYNEDSTQRADAQRVLQITADKIKERNRAAEGRAAVTGGTEESVAATKAANAKALSDAASRIAAAGEARKDSVEQQYMRSRDALEDRQMSNVAASNAQLGALEAQKAQSIANAAMGVGSALGSLAGLAGGSGDTAKSAVSGTGNAGDAATKTAPKINPKEIYDQPQTGHNPYPAGTIQYDAFGNPIEDYTQTIG